MSSWFRYQHNCVYASLHYGQLSYSEHAMLCVSQTDSRTTNVADVNWIVTVINQCRLPPALLITPRITLPAHRRWPLNVVHRMLPTLSLSTRRTHSSNLFGRHRPMQPTYQIVFGLTVLKCQEFFQLAGCNTTRGHRFKLMKHQCRGYRRQISLLTDLSTFGTFCLRM